MIEYYTCKMDYYHIILGKRRSPSVAKTKRQLTFEFAENAKKRIHRNFSHKQVNIFILILLLMKNF